MHSFNSKKAIILDTYVDGTFHWKKENLKKIGKIPYKNDWVGFIHHTFNKDYSQYNCDVLFEDECFIESLYCCKMLVVLSDYMKKQVEAALHKLHFETPVITLYHPTDFDCVQFDLHKFEDNEAKKIVHIGAFLRDMYSIYELIIDDNNKLNINKAILKGKSMDYYFKPKGFDLEEAVQLYCGIKNIGCDNGGLDICRDDGNICRDNGNICRDDGNICRDDGNICRDNGNICRDDNGNICRPSLGVNRYLMDFVNYINYVESKVELIEKLEDNDYDKLLSENLVFLKLFDASAVNTIIECIVRNTPVLVNKIPSVIEYLGEEYPFYYETNFEAGRKATDMNAIRDAYYYLKNMDKSKFRIKYFLEELMYYLNCDK